jgi:transposase-like protein
MVKCINSLSPNLTLLFQQSGMVWSNEGKTAIVLEIIRGNESAAGICVRHRVSAAQAYRLQEQFLSGVRP